MQDKLNNLKLEAKKEIKATKDSLALENVWRKYLGRNGQLRDFSVLLKDLSLEERGRIGSLINEIKKELEELINNQKEKTQSTGQINVNQETLDLNLSLTDNQANFGHLHPHTQVKHEVADIFHSMGFKILEGPEIENEHYAFDTLNIPASHPARDMWDTFWLDAKATKMGKLLLRPHTTAMQVRVMEKEKPPLRVCVIGKCYRHESTDAGHEHSFYQIDGFVVDENISVANLMYTLKEFLHHLFGQEINVRLRPSYFPFTEPSFELDFSCLRCGGKGCPVCGQTGWVEMLGCGMIHPNVFKAAGYPVGKYTGFAFGIGLDRLVMMRYKIDDIRWFNSGDLRFLRQF